MRAWQSLLQRVLINGVRRPDRTGVGTLSVFGESVSFDVGAGFPAVTTKHLAFGQVKAELECFLRGYDNLSQFHEAGCKIWDANGQADYWTPRWFGDLGRIYGVQWRDWRGSEDVTDVHCTDQLLALVDGIRKDPYGRRHVVTAWNPAELGEMCLPPCHILFQAYVRELEPGTGTFIIDLVVYMRSVDLFLGLPFDVASYALLQTLLAKELGMVPGRLTFFLGDSHIYLNHLDQVAEVLTRRPLPEPILVIPPETTLFDPIMKDVRLDNYQSQGAIPAPMNV